MGYTEEMELTVSGELQGLIVHKENDCFILEFLEESRLKNACEDTRLPAVTAFGQKGEVNNNSPERESRQKNIDGDISLPTVSAFKQEKGATLGNGLYEKLALLRKELATAENVPPYLIFNNKTLQEMAEKMPVSLNAMYKISGVGNAKLEKYGFAFIEAIKEAVA